MISESIFTINEMLFISSKKEKLNCLKYELLK